MSDIAAIVTTVAKIIKVAVDLTPIVLKTVDDARPFAAAIVKVLKGEEVTQEELEILEGQIDDLSRQLQLPLPPEE